MSPDRLPFLPRFVTFSFAVTVLLWLSLVPSEGLPKITFWDKAEHALAYLVLTGLGLTLFPRRRVLLICGVLAMGIVIEVLQTFMALGRQGDWRDVVANSTGVVAAIAIFAAVRWAFRRTSPRPL